MGKLGWSYPAGCNGPPDDEPCGCDCCGRECDSCICPACPECGEHGNSDCYLDGYLTYSPEQLEGRRRMEESNASGLDGDIELPW
jgi:hypothetical protein